MDNEIKEGASTTPEELVTPPIEESTPIAHSVEEEVTPPVTTAAVAADTQSGAAEATVVIKQTTLDTLLERLQKLEDEGRLRSQLDDKNTANKLDDLRRQGKIVKNVKLRKIEGKFVVGWKTVKDDVFFREGRLIEDQIVRLFFVDETTTDINLRQWATSSEYVSCEVIGESTNVDGNKSFKVITPDGQEIEIGIVFVN